MPARERLVSLLLVVATVPALARADESENWTRLRSMPRERRQELVEEIRKFDALSREEQAAIRTLDAQIAALPADQQAHYRAVLRRYHLWVSGLRDEQREQLSRARPGPERMALVVKLRQAERAALGSLPSTPLLVQLIPYTQVPPVELSRLLKIWFELPPGDRSRIEKLPPGQITNRLSQLARNHALKPKPFESYPNADVETLTRSLEADLMKKGEWPVPHRNLLEALKPRKNADSEKPAKAVDLERGARYRRHLAQNYYFLKHPPEKVSTENLSRFDAQLPFWIRSAVDTMPPDEARRRLTVLYRLVFPSPEELPKEMPKPKPPEAKPTAPSLPPVRKPANGSAPALAPAPSAAPSKKATPPSSSTPF